MTNEKIKITSGGCFCGAVRYEIKGKLRGVVNCHCSQCIKLNGNFGPHSKALKSQMTLTKNDSLDWFEISDKVRRGFCRKCGSGLFWDNIEQDSLGIIAGSIDMPTGLTTIGHIFVEGKYDFYEITDKHQQFKGSSEGELEGDYL